HRRNHGIVQRRGRRLRRTAADRIAAAESGIVCRGIVTVDGGGSSAVRERRAARRHHIDRRQVPRTIGSVMAGQAPSVQIFGVKNSQTTRSAERFFKERRVTIQYVDLQQKPIAAGEIKRFVDRFGWDALLDKEGKAFLDAGMKYLRVGESQLLEKVQREPKL